MFIFGTRFYDLITNKVNQVAYQPGQLDAQFHQYRYDADLRLNQVTSATVAWQAFAQGEYHLLNPSPEARYFYYTHGPLARTEIGEQVAGNDFRYNLQGWIMGVNNVQDDIELPRRDPGIDGFVNRDDDISLATQLNRWQARDEFAYALGFHDQAYTPIGGNNAFLGHSNIWSDLSGGILGIGSNLGLFNGNIAFMLVGIQQLERQQAYTGINAFTYQYDQLHRIIQSRNYIQKGGWVNDVYYANTSYSYDPNGNLKTLSRDDGSLDDLQYTYNTNANGDLINNRLNYIRDYVGPSNPAIGDIGDQAPNNYSYDAIGQLISDVSQDIYKITWNIQAKVDEVEFTNKPTVFYTYDPLGNRLTKTVDGVTTYYVRDAQGNTLATYEQNHHDVVLTEQHLYGSARIGMRKSQLLVKNSSGNLTINPNQRVFTRTVGYKAYEQTNHLGDVLVTLSDKVLGQSTTITDPATHYLSIVKNASMTYPFGWAIPNRTYTSTSGEYRFGFNGKENDKETGWQDYGFRLYNTQIARFFSVDPLSPKYPELTTYQFASNTPIVAIDLDGLEAIIPEANRTNLILVVEGFAGAIEPRSPNNTMMPLEIIIDDARANGLGALFFLNTQNNIQTAVYASSNDWISNPTNASIAQSVRNFREMHGENGRVILVGHSQGADNIMETINANPDLIIDLIITLDISDASLIFGVDDLNVPQTVRNAVNFYQDTDFIGEEFINIENTNTTWGVNILSPGSSHRSIDNDLSDFIEEDIQTFINRGEQEMRTQVTTRQLPNVTPANNQSSSGSSD